MNDQRPKYGNRKTEIDGYLFDSQAETRRYQELKLMQAAGEIDTLELQPVYEIMVGERYICNYRADFKYHDIKKGIAVVEDVKGYRTPVYRLKKKLVEALYGFEIMEVEA
jgi:hypothetical protein